MDPKGSICISFEGGAFMAYHDEGEQSFEYALHHLVEMLERFYRGGDIHVEMIEDVRLTLSYDEGTDQRVRIVYSGGPIRHLNTVACWFVATTDAGSDEVKELVRRHECKNRRASVA